MPLAYNQSGMGFFRNSLPGWLCVIVAASCAAQAPGPIQMEQSNTTASLRGIHAAGPGVAWASGTNGTVLRTEDGGFVWQGCAMPPGAEKLDFRGVWAWDAMTAIVMSSGPGDQSRLYKTTDGCVSWKLLATNSDKDGFWDAIAFSDRDNGYLLGDLVGDEIVLMRTADGGAHWKRIDSPDLSVADGKLGFFAASNSSLRITDGGIPWLATGSAEERDGRRTGPFILAGDFDCEKQFPSETDPCLQRFRFERQPVPLAENSDAAGIFSFDIRYDHGGTRKVIAVGGDYKQPDVAKGTAAWSLDGKPHWIPSTKPPHGYRSAVAWDADNRVWITAGPNGTDISRDDGRSWQSLESGSWNAISLPWLVGPNGRIGKLVSLETSAAAGQKSALKAGQQSAPATGQNAHSTKTGAKTR